MKMIRIIILTMLGSFAIQAYAQRCGTPDVDMSAIQQNDPARYQLLMQMEQQIANFTSRQSSASSHEVNEVFTIPVVVHVVHNGENVGNGLNISNAQINSQIEVLNDDFRRLNADTVDTPSEFQGVAADTEINFLLSCNRIRRYENTTGNAEFNYFEWSDLVAIAPAWDVDKYLNIWVCDMEDSLLGWASTPSTGTPSQDGIAINTTSFGTTGTVVAPWNLGRTATHEAGHWLDLIHIYGPGIPSCSTDDQVADTPNQGTKHWNQCPSGVQVSCGSSDMYMNYMDLTNDACLNLFTIGQKDRMRFHFEPGQVRNSIITLNLDPMPQITGPSLLCDAGGTYELDNLPAGLRVEWKAEPAYIFGEPTGTEDEFQTSANGPGAHGDGTITAKIIDNCTEAHTSVTYEIWVGHPVHVNGPMSGPSNVTACNLYIYSVPDQNDPTGAFDWVSPRGFTHSAGGDGYNYVQMWIQENAWSGYVQVWRTNACGNSGAAYKYVTVDPDCDGPIEMVVSPNPSSDEVSIEFTDPELLEEYLTNLEEKDRTLNVEIISIYGEEVYKGFINKNGLKLNLRNARRGIYVVKVYNKELYNEVKLILE